MGLLLLLLPPPHTSALAVDLILDTGAPALKRKHQPGLDTSAPWSQMKPEEKQQTGKPGSGFHQVSVTT
ncbi:hypothetical protein F2P81_004092 [Scophthalmus maximus]|uniref:Uncharacterized protein n=1 Tax=Scophthalmus maximus TaxID=52904 RepID=A0A6A4TBY3_SCOMX|nr:hypothetical protein F2P81_004092 [Scophthalmus maximus]